MSCEQSMGSPAGKSFSHLPGSEKRLQTTLRERRLSALLYSSGYQGRLPVALWLAWVDSSNCWPMLLHVIAPSVDVRVHVG